jgi:hypothetical protein
MLPSHDLSSNHAHAFSLMPQPVDAPCVTPHLLPVTPIQSMCVPTPVSVSLPLGVCTSALSQCPSSFLFKAFLFVVCLPHSHLSP